LLAGAIALAGCDTATDSLPTNNLLNAVLWTQTSAEYAADAMQAYRNARLSLDHALADPEWTAALEQTGHYADLPPAVVLDLDQTILDNSGYNAALILDNRGYSRQSHEAWCRQSTAPAIPGAKAFLDYASSRGVTVVYYSARREETRECTARNLKTLGLPFANPDRLLLSDGTAATSKARQRQRLARHYRILLLVGDNIDDFVPGSRGDPAARRTVASQHADRWGREWIILPNPMYGHWDNALYDFDYRLPPAEQLKMKLQQLRR
jgi:acid phosphatase